MITEIFEFIKLPFAGGFGGIVSFLYAFKKGHYKHNKYFQKFSIEFFGAMLTASFLTKLFLPQEALLPAAFLIGICWSKIIQLIRDKITKVVAAVLGEKMEE